MHSQPNAEALWAYLWTIMEIPSLASIFVDYQRTITFQISGDQDPAPQIAELNFLYTRLCENNCDVLFWKQCLFYLQSLTHGTLFLPLSFSSIYTSLILPRMLYILLFRWNSLGKLTPLMPLTILAFYVGINLLSEKRTLSSNSSCKVRVLLSSKREKRKITKAKKMAMLIKQIK